MLSNHTNQTPRRGLNWRTKASSFNSWKDWNEIPKDDHKKKQKKINIKQDVQAESEPFEIPTMSALLSVSSYQIGDKPFSLF